MLSSIGERTGLVRNPIWCLACKSVWEIRLRWATKAEHETRAVLLFGRFVLLYAAGAGPGATTPQDLARALSGRGPKLMSRVKITERVPSPVLRESASSRTMTPFFPRPQNCCRVPAVCVSGAVIDKSTLCVVLTPTCMRYRNCASSNQGLSEPRARQSHWESLIKENMEQALVGE